MNKVGGKVLCIKGSPHALYFLKNTFGMQLRFFVSKCVGNNIIVATTWINAA